MMEAIVHLAKLAGEAILSVYHDPHHSDDDWTQKNDGSPLTRADLSSHQCIVSGLQQITPSYPILSEESDTTIDYDVRKQWDRYWLVDPLDGTKEFIKRNGEFTVNIALIEQGKPVLGVVHAPVLNTTYYGESFIGAFKQQGDQQPEPISCQDNHEVITAVVSKSHMNDATASFIQRIEQCYSQPVEAVSVGSSLKLCFVAEGKATVYPRLGPTMEWDTAAADTIVRAAGGAVLNAETHLPLVYNKSNLLNPHFIVLSSGLSLAS